MFRKPHVLLPTSAVAVLLIAASADAGWSSPGTPPTRARKHPRLWSRFATPPKHLGEKLCALTRQECGVIWVDFTLRDVLPYE